MAFPDPPAAVPSAPSRSRRRWVLVAIAVFVIGWAVLQALDPYDERGIEHVSHGDHVHYRPQGHDPSVSVSDFPTVYPGPDERILPDGRVVPVR